MAGSGIKDRVFKIAGYFLAIFWIVFTALAFAKGDYSSSLWFCNFTVAVLAIACFQRSLNLIYFFLAIGLFFQTPWILDWANFFLTGNSFFGLDSFYEGQPLYFMVLTFLRHTLTIPLFFILLFFFEPKRPSRKAVFAWILAIFFIMFLSYSAGREFNINCSHYFCAPVFNEDLAGIKYTIGWSIMIAAVFSLSLYLVILPIHRLICRIKLV